MYNKLLISAGGGIISRDQQAEQEECATIAIGLGGTGISCLRTLKKQIFNRVKPDSEDALVAKYRHIKFLAVDTDKGSLGDTGAIDTLDSNTEFFDISCADIASLLSQAHLLAQNPSLQWLKTANTQDGKGGIDILSATAGAGGVRQVGRLLFLRSATAFVQKLTNIINEARKDLPGGSDVNIHIFTGLSGGTGAGTFMDVCYIVQHVLSKMGLGSQAYTCGYFFLPDVNMSNAAQTYIPLNGFASMKELDYAMNYKNNGGKWDQQYDGFRMETQEPPVKIAHLITATDADGAIKSNGYEYAMNVAVDYVLEYIIKPFIPESEKSATDGGAFTIKSHLANVNRITAGVPKRHGACYNYCILGAANAYIPYKEITTYLASKIFESFGDLSKQLPLDNDIQLFVETNGLKYDDFVRAITSGAKPIPAMPVVPKELQEAVAGIDSSVVPHLLKHKQEATTAISGKFAENKAALLDKKPSALVEDTKKINSIYTRIKTALIQISAQADKGPYYAGGILHNLNSTDILNIIEGYIKQNDKNIQQCRANMELRERNWQLTLRDFQNAGMLNRNKRCEDYVAAVHAYFTEKVKLEQYTVLGDIFIEIKKQLNELYETFFGIFGEVMRELQATFDANLDALEHPVSDDDGYAVKLMSLQDDNLKSSLDESISKMQIPDIIHGFVTKLLSTPEVWVAQDQNKISAAVSEYFLGVLSEFTSKSINDYLKIKFAVNTPEALQKKVYDEIITPLGKRSAPLFWLDGSGNYSLADSSPLGYLSIPNVSPEIESASEDYKAGHAGTDVRKAFAEDRISIFSFICGVPMFAYKGVANYKPDYNNNVSKNIGSHIYEGAIADPRDSRELIDISPISSMPESSLTEKEKASVELYAKALEAGVISKTEVGHQFEYKINIFDTALLEQRKAEAAPIIAAKNAEAAAKMAAVISNEVLPVKTFRSISNDGTMGYEEQVVRDHVLGSKELVALVNEQFVVIDEWNKLVAKINELAKGGNAIHDFAVALMTGAITKKNDYQYAYVKEVYGMEESTEFTSIDSVPYGMTLPLYSAYVGYEAASDEIKAEINQAAKTNLMNNREMVATTVASVKEMIEGPKLGAIMQMATTQFAAEAATIEAFIKRFVKEVATFSAMF